MKHLSPIRSLVELRVRAKRDGHYQALAHHAVMALDLNPDDSQISFDEAVKLLEYEAIANGEEEIVETVNSLLDTVEVA